MAIEVIKGTAFVVVLSVVACARSKEKTPEYEHHQTTGSFAQDSHDAETDSFDSTTADNDGAHDGIEAGRETATRDDAYTADGPPIDQIEHDSGSFDADFVDAASTDAEDASNGWKDLYYSCSQVDDCTGDYYDGSNCPPTHPSTYECQEEGQVCYYCYKDRDDAAFLFYCRSGRWTYQSAFACGYN